MVHIPLCACNRLMMYTVGDGSPDFQDLAIDTILLVSVFTKLVFTMRLCLWLFVCVFFALDSHMFFSFQFKLHYHFCCRKSTIAACGLAVTTCSCAIGAHILTKVHRYRSRFRAMSTTYVSGIIMR